MWLAILSAILFGASTPLALVKCFKKGGNGDEAVEFSQQRPRGRR
jgi:hypothetical protein